MIPQDRGQAKGEEPNPGEPHPLKVAPRLLGCLLSACLLAGCSKPRLSWEARADLGAPAFDAVAVDPRKDLAILVEGMHALDPRAVRELVLEGLAAKGYRLVPPEEARIWLDVYVLSSEAGHGPEGGAPGRSGQGSRGGGEGGTRGTGKGGRPGASSGHGRPEEGRSPAGPRSSGGDRTVIVQFVEPGTGNLLWHGRLDYAAGKPDPGASFEEQLQTLLGPLPLRR